MFALPRRLLRHPRSAPRRATAPSHAARGVRPQPVAERHLHLGPLRQDLRRGRATRASTATTTASRYDGGSRASARASTTSTPATITGGIYYWYDGSNWKTAFTGKVSHFADNFLGGSHDFKFGVQYNSGGSDYTDGQQRLHLLQPVRATARATATATPSSPSTTAARCAPSALYVDDTFRVNDRLTLNLGLRYDHSQGLHPRAPAPRRERQRDRADRLPASTTLYTWNTVSPRVGFNLEADRRRQDRAARPLRPLLPRRSSPASSRHCGPSFTPQLPRASGTSTATSFDPDSLVAGRRQHEPAGRPGLQEPLHRPVHRRLRAGADQGPRAVQLNYVHKKRRNYGGWRDTAGAVRGRRPTSTTSGTDATGQTIILQRLVSDPADRAVPAHQPGRRCSPTSTRSPSSSASGCRSHWQLTAALTYLDSRGRLASSTPGSPHRAAQTGQAIVHLRPEPQRLRQHRRQADRRPALDLPDPARLRAARRLPGRRELHLPERPALGAHGAA